MLSFGHASMDAVGDYPELLPPTTLFLRRGWAADSASAWGYSLGVQVSPLILLAELGETPRAEALRALEGDLYVQFPGGNPRGFGISGSRHGVMPYVQYGRPRAEGNAWYTTQGVAALATGNYRTVFWAPTFVLREVGFGGRHAVHIHVGGALGFSRRDNTVAASADWSPMWLVSAGVGLELGPETPTPP